MKRHDLLHEFAVTHQTDEIVREKLYGRDSADASRIKRRRMNVAAFHKTEHLARVATHMQRLAVELTRERVQRSHDIGNGPVAVVVGVRRLRRLGLLPYAWISLLNHLLAEVHADQIVLKDIVIEHVLGSFAQVDYPFGNRRRANIEGHVLRVDGAGRVIVTADPTYAAGDKVRVARVFALHENAVAPKD